jgi:predicted Zn-dependent peptidase
VTAEEVQELARRYLDLDKSAWAAVGPSADRLREYIHPHAEVM